jgi:molecular chaperone Hsp33
MQRDSLHRFVFENTPIRGNTVHLNVTLNQALQYHDYPAQLRNLLGELMAASALLSATLKMDGALILQIQGNGALKLLVVECTADFGLRATAKWDGDLPSDFKSMIGDGRCVITLDQKVGESYQGIVPLEGDTIAEMLENYMQQSQQIDTQLWLHCDGENAAGMLIQKLPEQPDEDPDAWARIKILADTVTNDELIQLETQLLLTRLFGEETVRLFTEKATRFYCGCNRNRVANMLITLGKDEIDSILSEQGNVQVNCEFCNKEYVFDPVDSAALFAHEPIADSSKSIH